MLLYHSGGIEYDLLAATSYGHVYLYNGICVYSCDLRYLMDKNVQNQGERIKDNGQKGAWSGEVQLCDNRHPQCTMEGSKEYICAERDDHCFHCTRETI